MKHIRKIPMEDVIFLSKTMRQTEIDNDLKRFRIDIDVGGAKPETARYIVATTGSMAVGLTLSEAVSITLLEPDFRRHVMLQCFCRHCRQGNKNPVTYSNLCVARGSSIEERINQVNDLRGSIERATSRRTNEGVGRGKSREMPVVIDDSQSSSSAGASSNIYDA
jgi:hypothetical protein